MAATLELSSSSEAETDVIGRRLADVLRPGDTVALIGDLGAGKTRLVQAVCVSLEVDVEEVTSPTFVLIQEYSGRFPVYHFDAYRLKDLDEFLELGAEEYFEGDGVCFVEWADRVAEALPVDHLRLEITATGPSDRQFVFSATGQRSAAMIRQMAEQAGGGQ